MNGKTSTKNKKKPWVNHNRPPQTGSEYYPTKNEIVAKLTTAKPTPQYRTDNTALTPINQSYHHQEQADCKHTGILFMEGRLNDIVYLSHLTSQEMFYIATAMCLSEPLLKLIDGCKIYKTLYKKPLCNRPVYFLEDPYWKDAITKCKCEQTKIGPYTVRRTDIIYICNMDVKDIEHALCGHALTEPLSFFIHRMKDIKGKQKNKEKLSYNNDFQFYMKTTAKPTTTMPTPSTDNIYHLF